MKQILEQLLNKQDLKRDEAFNVMLQQPTIAQQVNEPVATHEV